MAICSNGSLIHCFCFKWLLGHSGGLQVDLREEQQVCSLAAGSAPVQVTWAADQSGMYWRSQMFGGWANLGRKASAWQAHAPTPGIRPAGSTVTNSCAPVQSTWVGQSGGYWRSSQEQLAAPGYLKRAKQNENKGERKKGGRDLQITMCFTMNYIVQAGFNQ